MDTKFEKFSVNLYKMSVYPIDDDFMEGPMKKNSFSSEELAKRNLTVDILIIYIFRNGDNKDINFLRNTKMDYDYIIVNASNSFIETESKNVKIVKCNKYNDRERLLLFGLSCKDRTYKAVKF